MMIGKDPQNDEAHQEAEVGRYFVWYRNFAGVPEPQKWARLDFGERNWRRRNFVAARALTDDEWHEPLDALVARYPLQFCDAV